MKPILHTPPPTPPEPNIGNRQVRQIEAMLLQPEAYTLAERQALGFDLEPKERSIADILKTMP